MKHTTYYLLLFSILFAFKTNAQDYHVRFGFVGNSITIGAGLSKPTVECYPSQLGLLFQKIYGDTCIIKNYAVSGRTMLKHGDYPIWNEPDFKKCLYYAPNIVYIMLGTNDSKPYNWDSCPGQFYPDYKAIIDTFKWRNPRTKFIVCRPAPAFAVVWDIRDSVIFNGVIPLVDSIAKYANAQVIDFYHPLKDSVNLFPDKIHPSAYGATIFAKIAFENIVASDIVHKIEKGYTYVTSAESNDTMLRIGDSATISWNTLDADEVFFENSKVVANGSVRVAPKVNTKYKILAKGKLNSDSIVFEQKVYKPEVMKFYASPSTRTIYAGDTVSIGLVYTDQKGKKILNAVYHPEWTVTLGYGRVINGPDNTLTIIADSAGKIKLSGTLNSFVYKTTVTVNEGITQVKHSDLKNTPVVYPNPANKLVYIDISAAKPTTSKINVYDVNGKVCLHENRTLISAGKQSVALNTSTLKTGTYIYKIEVANNAFSGKIIIK